MSLVFCLLYPVPVATDRIVVFRPGALGDTIVAADALLALKSRYPASTLELVGNREAGALLRAAGLVDVVSSFDGAEVTDLFRQLPRVAPAWHGAQIVVLWLAGGSRIAAAFRASGASSVICRPSEPSAPVHVADYLVDTLAAAGVESFCASPALLAAPIRDGGADDGPHRVLLHPGSGAAQKNWPAERYGELAVALRRQGWPVALLEGPADAEAVSAVAARLALAEVPIVRPQSVGELASALAASPLLVGNDSGVCHLGARLGVPTVAIFGTTDPNRWAPRGPRVVIAGGPGRWPAVHEVEGAIAGLSVTLPHPPQARAEARGQAAEVEVPIPAAGRDVQPAPRPEIEGQARGL